MLMELPPHGLQNEKLHLQCYPMSAPGLLGTLTINKLINVLLCKIIWLITELMTV